MRRGLLALACVVVMACGSNPLAPTPTPVPACQANGTASVSFENRSTTNTTYTVFWDGAMMTTLAPGVTSQAFTVAASIQHSLYFRVANSSSLACSVSTPTLAQCASGTYWCAH